MALKLNPKAWIYVERLYLHCYGTKDFASFLRRHDIEYANPLYRRFRTTVVRYKFMSEENYAFTHIMQKVSEIKQLEILQNIVFDGTLRKTESDYFNYYGEVIGKWYPKILRYIRLARIKIDRNNGVLHAPVAPFENAGDSHEKITASIEIFISYARQDEAFALKLYDNLAVAGYKVWIDKKSLLPGQDWEREIKEKIHKANFVIVMLSHKSINKRGYYQKEIRLALDTLQEMPPKHNFLIPVRLDECEVSKPLSSYHWVDLFDDWQSGLNKIFESLKVS